MNVILKNLLFYRLVIFNTVGLCALTVSYYLGILQMLFERDPSGIVIGISGLFAFGLSMTLWRGWRISQWINKSKLGINLLSLIDLKMIRKLPSKSLLIYEIGGWLVALGLIGNALAFFLAVPLDGDNESLSAALRLAMPIAFGTTLWGSILMLWTYINHHMLNAATLALLEDIKE